MTLIAWIALAALLPPAILVALPAIGDLGSLLAGRKKDREVPAPTGIADRLLFLVPAHDESLLIGRCVRSLLSQTYPKDLLRVVIVADNCTDDTAALARAAGATTMERSDPGRGGKGFAIEWALSRIELADNEAVVIVDADTIVEPDFATQLMRWAPLSNRILQVFDGASNEFETWLTRLAGLFTRSRYGVALPLKSGARLSCPLTGDGVVIGKEMLRRHPWRVVTITEGWELYARLTLHGVLVDYAPSPRLYAQESQSITQSRTQRERWSAGRAAVLGLYWKDILTRPGLRLLQRIDLFAELTYPGPSVRGALGILGALASLVLPSPVRWVVFTLFAMGIVQPAFYALVALRDHPQRSATIVAMLRLPGYAIWRSWVGVRAVFHAGTGKWVRTGRRHES
jgi:cellulose synthase/poly-beta-1,6-N-acetylglucosamine synthase-like glycosyltransferase